MEKQINDKIQELKEEISVIEADCKALLNYGNPPNKNYNIVLEKLLQRAKYKEALSHVQDLKYIYSEWFNTPKNN